MKFLFLALALLTAPAWADPVKDMAELAMLPQYCRGTQTIREISKDPVPINHYVEMYGHAYTHLHHYCWALNAENNAARMRGRSRLAKLSDSLGDYNYVLRLAPQDFVFLPDIYTSRSRVFFALKRDADAVKDLYKAIELKADYHRAYARLSDYYQTIGDKHKAIQILKNGLNNTRNENSVAVLTRKLGKLGATYQGTPGSALQKDIQPALENKPSDKTESVNKGQAATPDLTTSSAPPPKENTTTDLPQKETPTVEPAKPNPYCRFCP